MDHPRKACVQIAAPGDDSSDDEGVTTPEVEAVKRKIEGHHIKQLSSLLKALPLANVDALLKKHLRPQMFQQVETGQYQVDVSVVALHGGIWRWLPDFALKPVPEETGRLHVGLQIGPYVVDWTDSHLVSIRTVASCQPLILVKLGSECLYTGTSVSDVESLLRSVAGVIVSWNTSRSFDLKKSSPLAFVDDVINTLKCKKLEMAPRVRDVLSEMQHLQKRKVDVSFSAEWANEEKGGKTLFGKKVLKEHKFRTHEELDEWMLQQRKAFPELESEHPDDWAYLLLLDRCFWCGIVCSDKEEGSKDDSSSSSSSKKEERDRALDRPREDGCAFGAPSFQKVMELELGSAPKKTHIIKKKSNALMKKE